MTSPRTHKPRFAVGIMLRLATPVIAAYVGQLTMGLVDTMVVGRLGAANLGGVALGNAMFYTAMIVGFGLLTGMDFLVAHAYGAGELKHCRKVFLHALLLAAIISIPLGLLPYLISFNLSVFGATADVVREAGPYLRMLSLSMPPVLIFMACRQYLQALSITRPAMFVLIAANLINLVANLALVLGWFGFPVMGTAGSGVATLLSRVFMAVAMGVCILYYDRAVLAVAAQRSFKFEGSIMSAILRLGTPASLQMLMEVAAFSGSTILVARLGATSLAAHQIVLQIASFTFMVPLGISSATAVLVGQNLGAKDPAQAARSGWTGFLFGASFMLCSGMTLFIFARPILSVFTTDSAVLVASKSILLLAALFQLADGLQVVGTGALRGVADTKTSMVANFFGHWCVGIPLGFYLCFYAQMGLAGLWTGLATGLAIVGTLLLTMWAREARGLTRGIIPPRVLRNASRHSSTMH